MAFGQVLIMEEANLFAGYEGSDHSNSEHLKLTEVKLPAWNEQYVDHRPGGAPVSIEIDTIFAKPEITFQLLGWDPWVAALIASWQPNQNGFFIYGLLRDRMNGAALQAACYVKGRLGLADPQNFARGNAMHWNYAIKGIVHYEMAVDRSPLYYWDFFTNALVVGGIARNADINKILNIPQFEVQPQLPLQQTAA